VSAYRSSIPNSTANSPNAPIGQKSVPNQPFPAYGSPFFVDGAAPVFVPGAFQRQPFASHHLSVRSRTVRHAPPPPVSPRSARRRAHEHAAVDAGERVGRSSGLAGKPGEIEDDWVAGTPGWGS